MKNNVKYLKYTCPKCRNKDFKVETVSTTGGMFSKIFNVQHRKFSAVICTKCTYTELYQTSSSKLENIFDFITG